MAMVAYFYLCKFRHDLIQSILNKILTKGNLKRFLRIKRFRVLRFFFFLKVVKFIHNDNKVTILLGN